MLAVGLMSGTSLDGVDVVLIEIQGADGATHVKEIGFQTIPYSEELRSRIKRACDPAHALLAEVSALDMELGYVFAGAIQAVCKTFQIDVKTLDFIASHGQTVYHDPFVSASNHGFVSTCQIGNASVIAYALNTQVISDFRVMDMVGGGQGAPLVPYSEYLLYMDARKSRALQNIGGIGNVTYIRSGSKPEDLIAFDTGPGNMMIDEAMEALYGLSYDRGGCQASQGKLVLALYAELCNHPYLQLVPPKSTGRELFGKQMTEKILEDYHTERPEDIIHTLTRFTAYSIASSYQHFILDHAPLDEVILAGGGAHNLALKSYLEELLAPIAVLVQEDLGYNSDSKEAVAFAILGHETLRRHANNVPQATGATEELVLGNITPAPKRRYHE
mgnify:CR=1 FL=1